MPVAVGRRGITAQSVLAGRARLGDGYLERVTVLESKQHDGVAACSVGLPPLRCGANEEADMAHALVMQVELTGSPEEADKLLHEIVVPTAQAQPGFKSGKWLHDGSGSGMGVVVFDTEENAEAAKGVLTPPPGGPKLKSSSVWVVGAEA